MISREDKQQLRTALVAVFDKFILEFSSFQNDEVNQHFPSSKWTPAQVATHIVMATDGVPDRSTGAADRAYDAMLPKIRPWWEDLNQKFQSPEQLRPDSKPHMKSELIKELKRVKEKDLIIVDNDDLSVICADMELPTIGFLTRYEWLWFIEMHLKRHEFQLSKMKK
jgi:DinB superfamily